jgi:hypothetical protein
MDCFVALLLAMTAVEQTLDCQNVISGGDFCPIAARTFPPI